MTPQKHSKLFSPSKSSLWLQCFLSTVFNDGSNEESSEVAEFGSECHELGSVQIANALGITDYEGNAKSVEEAIKEFGDRGMLVAVLGAYGVKQRMVREVLDSVARGCGLDPKELEVKSWAKK